MKRDFYDVNDAGKTFIWAVLAPQILGTLLYIVFLWISSSSGETIDELLNKTINVYIFLMLTQIAFALVFFMYNRKINYKKACKFNKLSSQNIYLCIIIAVVVLIGLTPISNIVVKLMELAGLQFSTSLPIGLNSIGDLLIAILLIALVPAVLEELIFRGMILQGLRKFGSWPAVLISAGLFALMHASAIQLVYTFLFGIVLALVVIKTGSIISSMICHFTANALSLILGYINIGDETFGVISILDIVFAFIMTLLTFIIVFSLVKKLKNDDRTFINNYILEMKKLEIAEINAGYDLEESEFSNNMVGNENEEGDSAELERNLETFFNNDEFSEEKILARLNESKSGYQPNNSTFSLKVGIIIGIVVWCISFSTYFL